MKVTAEKLDDINIVISGTVSNEKTEQRVSQLKEIAAKEPKKDDDTAEEMTDVKFQEHADSEILKEFIGEGLKAAGVAVEEVLGQPGFRKYEKRDEGIYIEIAVSTGPKINTDVEYMDVVPTYTKPVADDAEVEEKLQEMALQQGTFTAIENAREVQDGDVTVIDFEGSVDGVLFDGGSAEKFNLKVGSNSFIPGFEEQVLGMQYGEEKTISVTFPEDYTSEDLAGKVSEFKVKLHEIQEQTAAVTDDAFAKKILNDENATIDVLKGKLASQVTSIAISQLYNDELKPKLIKGLLTKFDFTLPTNIIDQEIDAKANTVLQQMGEEQTKVYKENKEEFHSLRETLREESEDSVKIALIVEALAKKEKLEADDQELNSALYYQAMMSGQDPEELVKYYKDNNLMHSAKMGLTQDKLFGMMLGFDKQ